MNTHADKDGGYLIPQNLAYQIMTGDLIPIKPRWWEVWKKSTYKKECVKWVDRFNKWQVNKLVVDAPQAS